MYVDNFKCIKDQTPEICLEAIRYYWYEYDQSPELFIDLFRQMVDPTPNLYVLEAIRVWIKLTMSARSNT